MKFPGIQHGAIGLAVLGLTLGRLLAAPSETVAVYDLQGDLSESGRLAPSLVTMNLDAERPLTFYDVTVSLQQAVEDDGVKALVLEIDDADLSLAQLSEIRGHLLRARERGKDVWFYSDFLTLRTAMLGSAASHFVLMPEATIDFSGLHAETLYFKEMLDRAGLQVEVVHIGDYKSFGEEFYRTAPSDFAAQQTEALIGGWFEEMLGMIAAGRGIEVEVVRRAIDQGTFAAGEAAQFGLVDALTHRSDFNQKLRQTYAEARFDRDFAMPERGAPQIRNLLDVFKLLMAADEDEDASDPFVAVVPLEGAISLESVAPVREAIIKLLDQESARALVLRIDSPGGSALASEVLWEATDEWRATGRPLAVSMGATAASGGYYVAAGAQRIFAEPTTLTGSIGVVGMKLVAAGAMEKLGIHSHSVTRGRYADAMTMTQPFDDEQEAWLRQSMQEVDRTFKKRVVEGRGDRLRGGIDELANGRVYTGRQALEVGLVDELGGLAQAIRWVADQAGLSAPPSRLLPEPRSPLDGLFAQPEPDEDGELVRMATGSATARSALTWLDQLGVASLRADQRRRLAATVERFEAVRESSIQLLGPSLHLRW